MAMKSSMAKAAYDDQTDKIVKMHMRGMTFAKIGECLDMSHSAVRMRYYDAFNKKDFQPRRNKEWSAEEDAKLRHALNEEMLNIRQAHEKYFFYRSISAVKSRAPFAKGTIHSKPNFAPGERQLDNQAFKNAAEMGCNNLLEGIRRYVHNNPLTPTSKYISNFWVQRELSNV